MKKPATDDQLYVVMVKRGSQPYEPSSDPVSRTKSADLVRRHWGSGRYAWRFPLPPETKVS